MRRVLLVSRRIGNDEFAPCGREVTIRNVNRDTLLPLCAEAIRQQRKIKLPRPRRAFALNRAHLVFIDALRVIEQSPDQRRFSIIDTTRSRETQQIFLSLIREKVVERKNWFLQYDGRDSHLEVALALLDLHRTFLVMIDDPVGTF